jgi:hypothetical protein
MSDLTLPSIPVRGSEPPKSTFGKWLLGKGEKQDSESAAARYSWYFVIWLTGVDLFSSLAYQPGLALLAAAALSPIATVFLIAVTLFGILPTYCIVSRHSYSGQGSIAVLEQLLKGWASKIFVLVLLGFACTDFVITTTLAAADASRHMIENPYLHRILHHHQIGLTLLLILLLAGVFLAGFTEAIGVSAAIVVPYLLLTLIVVIRCGFQIFTHPHLIIHWHHLLVLRGSWTEILLISFIVFPQLALGLSGFETGVSVMPFIKGSPSDSSDSPDKPPLGRIKATQKLLTTAAVLISFFLLATSFVTTLLIPYSAYKVGGLAAGRALAYLAHRYLGNLFGSLYDFWTILILWFTGASAVAGMLSLISRYLPRFGMAPRWVAYYRPLVIVITIVNILITLIFKASVYAQSGAYATGVLTLFFSAALAAALVTWKEARASSPPQFPWKSIYSWIVSIILFYTLVQNIRERPDGLIISILFILVIIVSSSISRYLRAAELRVESVTFTDEKSKLLWEEMKQKRINLVPLHYRRKQSRKEKAEEIRKYYKTQGSLAFIHVSLRDDRSEFTSPLKMAVSELGEDYHVEITGAVAVANTIAYISELLRPANIFLHLTRQNPMIQALEYLFWGEGEVGIMVYEILVRYWEWLPNREERPFIFLMSD